MALITLDIAMAHLRVTFPLVSPEDARQADLELKMVQAEAIILNYITATAHWATVAAAWTDETNVPKTVQAAILIQLAELYRFRGDDAGSIESGPARDDGMMSTPVRSLLTRYRDPVVA